MDKSEDKFQKYRDKLYELIDEKYGSYPDVERIKEFSSFINEHWSTDSIKLYRYSNADYYNIRSFEIGKLRLCDIAEVNDVFEGLPMDIDNRFCDKECMKGSSFIKCFSEEKDSILMWSHYGDKHRGICVEYDLSELEFKDDVSLHIFPVLYSKERKFASDTGEIRSITQNVKNAIDEDIECDDSGNVERLLPMFLFKSKDWEYEKEWRLIYMLSDFYDGNKKIEDNLDIKFDCITAIYLGYRIEKSKEEHIKEIVRRKNEDRKRKNRTGIDIYKCKLSNEEYRIEMCKID